jgi:hypothetical protein
LLFQMFDQIGDPASRQVERGSSAAQRAHGGG